MKWRCLFTSLVGLWLAGSAFIGFGPTEAFWNALVVGVLFTHSGYWTMGDKPCSGWIAYGAGIWLIIAAFIPYFTHGIGMVGNDLIIGLTVAFAELLALHQRARRTEMSSREQFAH